MKSTQTCWKMISIALFITLLGCGMGGSAALAGDGNFAGSLVSGNGYKVFMPYLDGNPTITAISGRIQDSSGAPLARVPIVADTGQTTVTDENGNYQMAGLTAGSHTLIPSKDGYTFTPESRIVNPVSTMDTQNFIGAPQASCFEEIANGGFESTGIWYIPYTVWSAGYSTLQKHAGTRSMRTGIVSASDNRYSYSDFGQQIYIPTDAQTASFSFWAYPVTSEAANAPVPELPQGVGLHEAQMVGDVQYLLVLDVYGNILEKLLWTRQNTQTWTLYTLNLMAYKGSSIRLHYGVYNDGWNGITSMFVDDASLKICHNVSTYSITGRVTNASSQAISGVTISTNTGLSAMTGADGNFTFTGLVTGTYTLTPFKTSYTFTPASRTVSIPPVASGQNFTATLTAAACNEAFINGGFETNLGWELPLTVYPAGFSTAQHHSGSQSLRTGIVSSSDNQYSYSSGRQTVVVPSDTTTAPLRFWLYLMSGDTTSLAPLPEPLLDFATFETQQLAGDVQYVLVLDGSHIDTLLWQLSNSKVWTPYEFDLAGYKGHTIMVQFGTYNTGFGGVTAQYVDDASLQICK